ncbi:MAG TPA: circadian clock KaiB family protein [Bryobacteraceae bacterium]|nr:circadian clock KaiB family protein [Bryobacteraceae bacterium]
MDSPQPESIPEVLLRLFITGNSQRSLRAIEGVQGMCKELLGNGVRLEVVDVIERPDEAEREKILATPTLIRQIPAPPRRLVGDMAEPERVVQLLGLKNFIRPRKA